MHNARPITFVRPLMLLTAVLLSTPADSPGQSSPTARATPPPVDVTVVNTRSQPVPVIGTVNVGNTLTFRPAVPEGAFSVQPEPRVAARISGRDAVGSRYAITSLTVENTGTLPARGVLVATYGDLSPECEFADVETGLSVVGPGASVLPGDTVHLTFPQPFILSPPSGPSCLLAVTVAGSATGLRFTVVGYRF